MVTECVHIAYRWLDCADCAENGDVCDVMVCADCGADMPVSGVWEYGERYNDAGEWNPRLVFDSVTGEYVEPEGMPMVVDYDDQCYCALCDEDGYCPCDTCDDPRPSWRLTARGKIVVVTGFVLVLGFVGWIEGIGL
jgi:hypothetical protein